MNKLTAFYEKLDSLLDDGVAKNFITPSKHNDLLRDLIDAVKDQTSTWVSKTISYEDIQINSTTNEVQVLIGEDGYEQNACRIEVTTPFAGSGILSLDLSVGDSSDNEKYAYDVDCLVLSDERYTIPSKSDGAIKAYFTGSGSDLNSLTQGELTVYLRKEPYKL